MGERDPGVLAVNQAAREDLRCETDLRVVPGAGHLFQEPGAMDEVAEMAAAWFRRHLVSRP